MKKMIFVLLLAITTVACNKLNDPISVGSGIPGIVVSAHTNSPIEGATVTIAGQSGNTAMNGRFFFFAVPEGDHLLTVTKAGYLPYEQRINVTPSTDIRVALVPQQ